MLVPLLGALVGAEEVGAEEVLESGTVVDSTDEKVEEAVLEFAGVLEEPEVAGEDEGGCEEDGSEDADDCRVSDEGLGVAEGAAEPDVKVGRGDAEPAVESCRSMRLPCCMRAAAWLAFNARLRHNQILDSRILVVLGGWRVWFYFAGIMRRPSERWEQQSVYGAVSEK